MTASSAMQSQLQRNSATLPVKFAKKAAYSRYSAGKLDRGNCLLSSIVVFAVVFLQGLYW
jgi:hypothetical protein